MKAAYILWPNYEYIDKLVDASIDTLLVTCHDLPWDVPSNYYDSRDTIIDTINRYKSRCRILIVPLWIRPWTKVRVEHRWQTRDGRLLARTPCPTSKTYINERTNHAMWFAKEVGADGIIWDLEHLEKDAPDIVPFYHSLGGPEHRCYCPICMKYSMEDLWKVHAGLIRKQLDHSGIQIHGQMPYSGGWTMRQYPGQLHHFTQETYQGDVSWWERKKWAFTYKRNKVKPTIVPGVWCEWFHDEFSLINYLRHLKNKYGGFELYSHEFFGNRIPNPHVKYPNPGPATDWFFRELRKI